MNLVFSGMMFGMALMFVLRTAVDSYVERYKRRHHQWPHDKATEPEA